MRCAVVGLGRIGSMLEDDTLREKPCTHAGAIAADSDCVLAGGCDLRWDRCVRFRDRWGCVDVYTEVEELLAAAKPDIVHIAAPPEEHLALVESVLGSSASLIVCEKPLAPSADDGARIAYYHRSGTIRILVNHERRYSADYLAVKDRLENGVYGELLSIHGRIYLGRTRSPLDMLLDDGTHLIDVIRFLTESELEDVHAELLNRGGVESLFAWCSAGGTPVHMEIASGRDHVVFELDLSFSRGRIRIGNGLYEEHRSVPSPYYEGFRSLAPMAACRPPLTGYFSNMLRDAVRCVRDHEAAPRSTAVDGYRAVTFIEQVYERVGAGCRRRNTMHRCRQVP